MEEWKSGKVRLKSGSARLKCGKVEGVEGWNELFHLFTFHSSTFHSIRPEPSLFARTAQSVYPYSPIEKSRLGKSNRRTD